MEWLRDHLWETWLAVAILLGLAEMFSLDMFLAMLAVGALGGMVTALVTDAIVVQVLVAAAVSVGMLAVVRPSLAKKLHGGPELTLGHEKLIGHRGVVTEEITGHGPGRIRIAGEIWSADTTEDDPEPIPPGRPVEVVEIRGATAYVRPVAPPELGTSESGL